MTSERLQSSRRKPGPSDSRASHWTPACAGVTALFPVAALFALFALGAQAQAPKAGDLPIFDAHVHYSHDAWDHFPPPAAIELLRKAGLRRALISSSNDAGQQRLRELAPELVLLSLRPYRSRGETGSWMRDATVIDYLEQRLAQARYVALGEYHLHGADADLPVPRRVVELARQHKLVLHSHSDAEAIERQFAQWPQARILWAHAGFDTPARVRELLRKYPTLWCDLAFRTDHAPDGKLDPQWRALFLEFPERFMVGTDTFTPERWPYIVEHARWSRQWLAQLPREVAERIAWKNGEQLFAGGAAPAPLTDIERARILSFGPWPPPRARDPSNRVSGNADAIVLGRRLFFDPRMSKSGYIGCVSCHQPDRAFTDNRARAHGIADVPRNTPTLANLRLQRWYGWGGGADSLWMQSILPLLDQREIESSPALVQRLFVRDPELACLYRVTFGRAPKGNAERVLVNVGKALAAFQETLITGRTPFDELRDALASSEPQGVEEKAAPEHDPTAEQAALARYPAAALRGLKLFVGRGNCFLCHSGPNFSNGEFHATGVPSFIGKAEVDPGRHEGLRKLRASAYNLLGPHNDDAKRTSSIATRHVTLEHRHWGEFRTPSLRNVAVTAPYMHNGQFETLAAVLRHYSELDPERLHARGENILRPLHLSDGEVGELIAFLQTLTDAQGERRTLPPREKHRCDE
jgi:cytochrome c peroxidase